jgi:murein DD-endopeptidase MepM/ murein hydrolase activator NlpD
MIKTGKCAVFLFLLSFVNFAYAQEDYKERMQQEFENYKKKQQQDFDDFKKKREEELKKMENAYQDYYNELYGLKNYYEKKNDTTGANIVEEMIEYENTICEVVKKEIKVTENVEVKKLIAEEEKQSNVEPIKERLPEKVDTATSRPPVTTKKPDAKPDETTFKPLPEEGNSVPVLIPLPPSKARITSPFGMRFHPVLKRKKMHNGIDFGSGLNAPVYAAADGKVSLAQYSRSYGNWVMLEHKNGYVSVYAHLKSYNIRAGLQIKKGDIIGYTGSTGRSSGPHLHFEIRLNGTPVNPDGYLVENKR